MKRIFTLLLSLSIVSTTLIAQGLTGDEKKKALSHLKDSQSELLKAIKGLSEEQLNFKPEGGAWSIAECMEHIAISENNIFGIVQMTLQKEANAARREEVAMTDEAVIGLITSREQKVKTRTEFEPTNSFGSYDATVEAFLEKRKSNMLFVKKSEEDLRNRYFQFPFGLIDSYQVILFMSGHTVRHTDQIKEVMTNSDFPS